MNSYPDVRRLSDPAPSCPTITIRLSPDGAGSVHINGKEVPNVKRLSIRAASMESPQVEFELAGCAVEIELASGERIDVVTSTLRVDSAVNVSGEHR